MTAGLNYEPHCSNNTAPFDPPTLLGTFVIRPFFIMDAN